MTMTNGSLTHKLSGSGMSQTLVQSFSDHSTTKSTFRLRLHAANLPRQGRLRKLPETFARVVSFSNRIKGAELPLPEEVPYNNNKYTRTTAASFQRMNGFLLGETETIKNTKAPQWTETILIDYEDNLDQAEPFNFTVTVFQVVQKKEEQEHISLGSAIFEVGDILKTKRTTRVKRLRGGGCVFARLEPVQLEATSRMVRFRFAARDLDLPHGVRRINLFNKSPDTVFEIAKRTGDQSREAWLTVFRSEVMQTSKNPDWNEAEIELGKLCNGDWNRHLRFSVKHVRAGAPDEIIGISETTLKHLLEAVIPSERSLESALKAADDDEDEDGTMLQRLRLQRSSSKLKGVGSLLVCSFELVSQNDDDDGNLANVLRSMENACGEIVEVVDLKTLSPVPAPIASNLQDFLARGCQIDFGVAIDFTSSNGDPRLESSLHNQSPDSLNDYEETITAIGKALQDYNKSQEYCVWGFGAKFDGVVRHVFQCGDSPTVHGVDGILTAYKSMFQTGLVMSGPTVFDQVIQSAAVRARKSHQTMTSESLRYHVLLMITDGIMNNLEETQRKLAVYSEFPLSIIFVGVGRSDFGSMYQLCQHNGHRCTTTFAEFRQHQHDPAALGEAALRNIPGQLCEYMQQRGF